MDILDLCTFSLNIKIPDIIYTYLYLQHITNGFKLETANYYSSNCLKLQSHSDVLLNTIPLCSTTYVV